MGLVFGEADLFGGRPIEGVMSGDLFVKPIPKWQADTLIRSGHYSGSVAWSSNLHLGVYHGDDLVGALQFGPAMNPARGSKVVAETGPENWIELNRMWLAAEKPANCGSTAISCALRFIRKTRPEIQWVQSFADGRCGKLGGLYQASNFVYCGSHESTFYELDGEWFHKSMVGRKEVDKRGWGSGPKIARLRVGMKRAKPHKFRQYRYIYFLDQRAKKRLLLPILAYPKPAKEAA
jgi:hypothetical protein